MEQELIIKGLELIGLNEKESKVYLACLKLGSDSVYNIAREAKLKRPTVYFVLDKLKNDGLVSLRQTRKASLYSAINPHKLMLKVEQQKEKFLSLIPQMEDIYHQQPNKPTVKVFEGEEGVELVYREIGEWLKKYKEVLYFGSTKHFLEIPEYARLLDLYIKQMKNKRYKAREILVESELDSSNYIEKILANNNSNHQIRLFSKKVKFFEFVRNLLFME